MKSVLQGVWGTPHQAKGGDSSESPPAVFWLQKTLIAKSFFAGCDTITADELLAKSQYVFTTKAGDVTGTFTSARLDTGTPGVTWDYTVNYTITPMPSGTGWYFKSVSCTVSAYKGFLFYTCAPISTTITTLTKERTSIIAITSLIIITSMYMKIEVLKTNMISNMAFDHGFGRTQHIIQTPLNQSLPPIGNGENSDQWLERACPLKLKMVIHEKRLGIYCAMIAKRPAHGFEQSSKSSFFW